MRAYIGITDYNWYSTLAATGCDEVNFWRPSAGATFKALKPNDIFLFKLHKPKDFSKRQPHPHLAEGRQICENIPNGLKKSKEFFEANGSAKNGYASDGTRSACELLDRDSPRSRREQPDGA